MTNGCVTPIRLGLALGLLLGAAGAGAQVDPLTQEFTAVEVEGYLPYRTGSPFSPYVSVAEEINVGASTTLSFSANAPEDWSPADMDSYGYATPGGALGVKVDLSGPSARQASVLARTHDLFTVLPPPGVAQGTPGVMTFVYHVDGVADVIGLPGETPDTPFTIAVVQLVLSRFTPDGGLPPNPVREDLGVESLEVLHSRSLGGGVTNGVDFTFGRYVSFDVPFAYGVPVALQTTLRTVVFTDNGFFRALFNPYREVWGGGVVQNVFVDSSQTTELVAIVNAEQPQAAVTGLSSDYSGLVVADFVPPDDADGDGVSDGADNCTFVPNTDQRDANLAEDDDASLPGTQHYGDACDADLDGDGLVAANDFFATFLPCLGQPVATSPGCAVADFDGDGQVGTSDFFGVMRPAIGSAPGPGFSQ